MKAPVIVATVTILLGACANQQDAGQTGMSRNQEPPSAFQSVGSCEPTGWVGLQQDAQKLPPDQRQRVMNLLQDAQSQHAEANQGQCIMTLQQAERIVRQGTGTS